MNPERISRTRLVIPLAVALTVPLLSYTFLQLTQRNRDEDQIVAIYERQLNTIVFSVNQFCWDTFRSWVAQLRPVVGVACESNGSREALAALSLFVRENHSVVGAIVQCAPGKETFCAGKPSVTSDRLLGHVDVLRLEEVTAPVSAGIDKVIARARRGYVQPYTLPWDSGAVSLLVAPVVPLGHEEPVVTALLVQDSVFIDEVIARKFGEMDDGNFAFAVRDSIRTLLATEKVREAEYEHAQTHWLLPHLTLQAGLKGTTLSEVAAGSTRRSMALLVFVNVVLIVGIFFLVRSVRAEVALARQKTDFVANVSHELRTPLSLISMHVETLSMGRVKDEEKRRHYYRVLLEESGRLSRLVDNILDFFRIESGRKDYHLAPGSLLKVVQEVLEMYDFHLQDRALELNRGLPDRFPPVRLDPEAVSLALINVLDNAVKYSGEQATRIDVGLDRRGKWAVVWVRDYGVGIPESEHRRIFEKFYRVGGASTGSVKGSGLGLSLVGHIMKVHHGKVTVDSSPGDGSTFSLWFPIHEKRSR